MASDVGEDFGTETELANGLTVSTGLLRGAGGSQLDVFYAKGIERLSNGDLGLGVEESIGELLSL